MEGQTLNSQHSSMTYLMYQCQVQEATPEGYKLSKVNKVFKVGKKPHKSWTVSDWKKHLWTFLALTEELV